MNTNTVSSLSLIGKARFLALCQGLVAISGHSAFTDDTNLGDDALVKYATGPRADHIAEALMSLGESFEAGGWDGDDAEIGEPSIEEIEEMESEEMVAALDVEVFAEEI